MGKKKPQPVAVEQEIKRPHLVDLPERTENAGKAV